MSPQRGARRPRWLPGHISACAGQRVAGKRLYVGLRADPGNDHSTWENHRLGLSGLRFHASGQRPDAITADRICSQELLYAVLGVPSALPVQRVSSCRSARVAGCSGPRSRSSTDRSAEYWSRAAAASPASPVHWARRRGRQGWLGVPGRGPARVGAAARCTGRGPRLPLDANSALRPTKPLLDNVPAGQSVWVRPRSRRLTGVQIPSAPRQRGRFRTRNRPFCRARPQTRVPDRGRPDRDRGCDQGRA